MKQPLLLFTAAASLIILGCSNNNNAAIQLPDAVPQPITRAIHFSAPQKLIFSDTVPFVITQRKLDFNALPEKMLDSSSWKPFTQKPDTGHFSLDNLPSVSFDYNKLPTQPLQYETFITDKPTVYPVTVTYKETADEPVYTLSSPALDGAVLIRLQKEADGTIWITDSKGLYRFDGTNLTSVLDKDLTHCFSLIRDSSGLLWFVLGNEGLYSLDIKNQQLHYYSNKNMDCEFSTEIVADNEGHLFVSTTSGLRIIDLKNKIIKTITPKEGLRDSFTLVQAKDADGNLWFGDKKGIGLLSMKTQKIQYTDSAHGFLLNGLSGININVASGEIWAGDSYKDIQVFNRNTGRYGYINRNMVKEEYPLKWGGASVLFFGNTGNSWVRYTQDGSNGICDNKILNLQNGGYKPIRLLNKVSSQNIVNVGSAMQDVKGQQWISTYPEGIFMLHKAGYNISSLEDEQITSIAEDRFKNIWMATFYNGIEIYNPSTGKVKMLNTGNGLSGDTMQDIRIFDNKMYAYTTKGIDIIDSNYQTIQHLSTLPDYFFNNKGKLWLANFHTGKLEIFDIEKKLKSRVSLRGDNDNDTVAYMIRKDYKDNTWVVVNNTGKTGFIDSTASTIQYIDSGLGIKNTNLLVMQPDGEGNVWMSVGKTIYEIHKQKDSVTIITPASGLPEASLYSLNPYKGRIYVSTSQGISIIYTPEASPNKKWYVENFGKSYGLNYTVEAANADVVTADGTYLWAGAPGVTTFKEPANSDTAQCTAFITGMDIFGQPQYFPYDKENKTVTADTLWTLSKNKYYLKGQKINTTTGVFQNIMNWDSTAGNYSLPVHLSVPYDVNTWQFHFSQTRAGTQDTMWYTYMLEGADKQWSGRTTNTWSHDYFNLSPGSYTFKVCAAYKGVWSQPATFSFTIQLPWYRKWWAYLLYIIAAFGIFSIFRALNLNRQNKLLEVKVDQRTQQLNRSLEELKSTQAQLIQSEKMASLGELTAGIAHEIQNPLNFVNNFSEVNQELISELVEEVDKGNTEEVKAIANDIKANEEKINHHGKRADSIVKGMLQHSRQTSGAKERTDINALCDEYLRLSYHGLRAKDKNFNAEFKTDFDQSIGKINIIPQDISRVLLNLYNNAFYAVNERLRQAQPDSHYQPTVSVGTKKTVNSVTISVSDNGNGIPQNIIDKIFQPFYTTKPTGEGTGLGLSLAYDIITKQHGGSIHVNSKEGEGSEFVIHLLN